MVVWGRGHACLQRGAVVALMVALAGCTTSGQPTVAMAPPSGSTIAFESIEGPPDGVFRKLVQALTVEAEARPVAFVSREDTAQYRIRGYLAAHVQKKHTTIAWVWDVYDAQQQRALRIAGEQASDGNRTGWAAVDDALLRRIAHDGMDRLTAYIAAPNAEPQPAAPPDAASGVAVSALQPDTVEPALGRMAAYRAPGD